MRIEANGDVLLGGRVWGVHELGLPGAELELPVHDRGLVVGRFVLTPTPAWPVSQQRRVVAVALSDQVGALLAATPALSVTSTSRSSRQDTLRWVARNSSEGGSCAVKNGPVWHPCEKSTMALRGNAAARAIDPGVERIVGGGGHPDRCVGQSGGVGHRVVVGEIGCRGVGTRVGCAGLGVARPDGRTDGGHRAEDVGVLLGQDQRAVPAHGDTHAADAVRARFRG